MGKVNEKILLIGGGGHCHSVIDSLCNNGKYDRIGVIAKDELNYEVLKKDKIIADFLIGIDLELPNFFQNGWKHAFITLGSIGDSTIREKIYFMLEHIGFDLPIVIDKTSVVSEFSQIGAGVFIGKKAIVNAGSKIGRCAIINTGAIIEHDCEVGNFTHISPGTILCGKVKIGSESHIGAGSVIKQGIFVGNNAFIGAGSVVVNDVSNGVMAYGNPCRMVG